MLYTPPTGSTDPNAPYIGKNVSAGIQGSKVPPKAVENPQREIVAVIQASGESPTNDDTTQLLGAIRGGQLTTFTDQGAANALVLASVVPFTAIPKGQPFRIFPAFTNTSETVTVQVGTTNPLTASLRKKDGSKPSPGDLQAGVPVDVVGDGTYLRLLAPTPSDIENIIASSGNGLGYVQIEDQNYGAEPTDRILATDVPFTAPRTITLPAAETRIAGDTLVFLDRVGAVSAVNTLTFNGTGADKLDGASSFAIGAPYQVITFRSDGTSKWTYDKKLSPAFRAAGDADVAMLPTDGTVATSVALTAPRTWTLPPANSVPAGTPKVLADLAGKCGPTTGITLHSAGTDTLNGVASFFLTSKYFQVTAISDGVSGWALQIVDSNQFATVSASLADGGVIVSVTDPTHVKAMPKNGGTIYVNGTLQQIPSTGLSIGNSSGGTGLQPLTQYFLYLAVVAGAQTLEWSKTGHAPDSAGREVRSDDPSRRLLCWIYTNASGQFQNDLTWRGLSNFFNRQTLRIDSGAIVNMTVQPSTTVPLSNAIPFYTWAGDTIEINLYAETNSGSNLIATGTLNLDASPVGHSVAYTTANATYATFNLYKDNPSEGFHTTQGFAAISGPNASNLSFARHYGFIRG